MIGYKAQVNKLLTLNLASPVAVKPTRSNKYFIKVQFHINCNCVQSDSWENSLKPNPHWGMRRSYQKHANENVLIHRNLLPIDQNVNS